MTRPVVNVLTGEVADDNTSVEALRTWEAMLDDMVGDLIRSREGIREAIATRTETPRMPRRRWQTDTQSKVTLCPRCRRRYEVGEETAA